MQHDASASQRTANRGRLVYLMGPSGAGKDSLLDAARSALQCQHVEIARRVITRSAEAKGEDALAVSPEQFEQMSAGGAFALQWRANGLAYGIPAQIDAWLAEGRTVVVNGSRAHLPLARERYPQLLPVLLSVAPQVLRQRLLSRGRESQEDIERRLERAQQVQVADCDVQVLDNSTSLSAAVQGLLALLREQGLLGAG
ncbi:phosphonate metabolism protein/1,5-bisphosphokinase (PRPP-forming) PhnN [Pseudomonas rubra]|uniref:Ribose 1,5-bisphosphate phosphokinase PhnN n=1 Tax=Pseudomonas rubra TaxID=2942627 RepID=A0ABT5P4P4_9PSED|nr:phosphonate metabolism protein/1,5-bisphosphokinase (PRPP-forming) PhnN [Pseudomonas rubra]MDD1013112.1 phosphonate metabolism protein/1,5-bisphosphokinase (PRPP-forming) PhnN [Pseudomonas rubra]MDD1036912.1 phosphonate metabolism protein/1,5-bisphosphokinase (PRPP-forming) PhnN [Pseudomonas rubra]MDD1154494.1 phosphonate metabolism protein/1,5-bisphosphokinase (PRPP-forming) PhnN [Pseudomonas rubra]